MIYLNLLLLFNQGCFTSKAQKIKGDDLIHLITLAPGHFHAALLQKNMYGQVDSTVYVFAPDGSELRAHLALIQQYNTRSENPTRWKEKIYTGADYVNKMLDEKPGNVVVIAGNNQRKIDFIKKGIDAGLNVLADKPMVITKEGFKKLQDAFAVAQKKKILLYDIMTQRFEITNILQRAFAQLPEVFGELQKGTIENPGITFESTHYFYKEVSGSPLIRPSWFFDVDQQGEGIVDVTTHLVDLIQWECFPELILNYKRDIQMLSAKHWATILTPSQFKKVTNEDSYPDFLKKNVKANLLSIYANGEMNYTIKGIHARVSVLWNFEGQQGMKDTYHSLLKGSKANLVIKQSKEQKFKPVLYIESSVLNKQPGWEKALKTAVVKLNDRYPGIDIKKAAEGWEVIIPEKYHLGHEHHFTLVFEQYMKYLREKKMASWEVPNMLAKYYTTTEAWNKANSAGQ